MQVVVNGDPREVPEAVTVAELLAHLGWSEGPVAVEVNRQVVPRKEHGTARIQAGDVVEIVHFVGGG